MPFPDASVVCGCSANRNVQEPSTACYFVPAAEISRVVCAVVTVALIMKQEQKMCFSSHTTITISLQQ